MIYVDILVVYGAVCSGYCCFLAGFLGLGKVCCSWIESLGQPQPCLICSEGWRITAKKGQWNGNVSKPFKTYLGTFSRGFHFSYSLGFARGQVQGFDTLLYWSTLGLPVSMCLTSLNKTISCFQNNAHLLDLFICYSWQSINQSINQPDKKALSI